MFNSVPLFLETEFHGQTLRLETGLLAQQATASVVASIGETTVMANVVVGKKKDGDYFPLQVIYEEKMYASGKIKGSRFIKREGRPSENAVLTGRMVDRSLRSLFDSHIRNEVQVIITVLSLDEHNSPDLLAVLAASSALKMATDQFMGPVSAVRVGLKRQPAGEVLVAQATGEIEKTEDFADLIPFLKTVSESLDAKKDEDKEYLRQIARTVANKSTDWAKEFSKIYKETVRLSETEIADKLNLKNQVLINPSYIDLGKSLVDLVVSGDGQNIMMVEAGANIVDETVIGNCLDEASKELAILKAFQEEFVAKVEAAGLAKKVEMDLNLPDQKFEHYWHPFLGGLEIALYTPGTKEIKAFELNNFTSIHWQNLEVLDSLSQKDEFQNLENLRTYLVSHATNPIHAEVSKITGEDGLNLEIAQCLLNLMEDGFEADEIKTELKNSLETVIKKMIQKNILDEERRIDGRRLNEVRKLLIETDVLPRVHGSSLFQRGETQVLNILTLGTLRDAQTLDEMEDFEETTKRYIHHYNFPAYSVGETGRYSSPGRREIGHGALAEKALLPVLPAEEDFPYTMRLVSECLGSNGSTSMASTCGSTLSLMAGGVPIKDMVAGIAMGLVVDSISGHFKVLTDIQGEEDHNGDMDFKVTGTKDGITAIQLDNKVAGLTSKILKQALFEAKEGRMFILEKMKRVISEPKKEISKYAPGVLTIQIPVEKIGDVIGPAGKIIKSITQKYGVEIDIADDNGKTYIYGDDTEKSTAARDYILALVKEFEAGEPVSGKVFRIENYGAFVKIMAGGQETEKEALIHISNLSSERVNEVGDVLKMGDVVQAKVLEINDKGQISLTLK
jgi:polyribonucleotide nucleotidyltransferase